MKKAIKYSYSISVIFLVIWCLLPSHIEAAAPDWVNDGTGTDINFTTSTTQLSANWAETVTSSYLYAIGTDLGGIAIVSWTDVGLSTGVTKTGLSLDIGTTYYFSVSAGGGITSSDGQCVIQDITPPPSVDWVNDGTGTDISIVTLSSSTLSANWAASGDMETGISGYWYAIGTALGDTDTVQWTYNANTTRVTKTGLDLVKGSTYYFSIKAQDGVGLQSEATNSDGQLVVDITPPLNISWINDGTGADIDSTYITNELSANWAASTDPESAVLSYKYAVGTNLMYPEVVGWVTTAATSVTRQGMILTVGVTYYFTAKVVNEIGLESEPINSDGQWIDQTDMPPKLYIMYPVSGVTVWGIVTVVAIAADDMAVSKIEFYVDDVLKNTDTEQPYIWTWDTTSDGPGNHIIKTIAYDTLNQTGEDSITVKVEIKNIKPKVYPNPYVLGKDTNGIQFKGLAGRTNATIKIYSLSGKLVKKIETNSGELTWDCKNEDAKEIVPGLYIYVITDELGNKKTGKFSISK